MGPWVGLFKVRSDGKSPPQFLRPFNLAQKVLKNLEFVFFFSSDFAFLYQKLCPCNHLSIQTLISVATYTEPILQGFKNDFGHSKTLRVCKMKNLPSFTKFEYKVNFKVLIQKNNHFSGVYDLFFKLLDRSKP